LSKAAKDPNESTLLYVYCNGHGVMHNTTHIVLNEVDIDERYYPLEEKISSLSAKKNCFVTSIFDCCREPLPNAETRSTGYSPIVHDLSEKNLYITFGCAPKLGVPAKSTIVASYTQCVKEYLQKTGGILEIPGALDIIFNRKFEKSAEERRHITRHLYYDVTRGGKVRFSE
jgi:hypothetical protein